MNAERWTIGALLRAPDRLEDVRLLLPSAVGFTDETMGALYSAALALADTGRKLDSISLADEAKRYGRGIGDVDRSLAELRDEVFSAALVIQHAAIVADKYTSRQIVKLCGEVSAAVIEGDPTSATLDRL